MTIPRAARVRLSKIILDETNSVAAIFGSVVGVMKGDDDPNMVRLGAAVDEAFTRTVQILKAEIEARNAETRTN